MKSGRYCSDGDVRVFDNSSCGVLGNLFYGALYFEGQEERGLWGDFEQWLKKHH